MERKEKSRGQMYVDMAIIEGADYLLDLEEASLPNTKRFRDLTFGNDGLDANYISFLKDIHDYCAAKFGEAEEDDGSDPSYVAFLGNLKAHGNAYMCDVSVENDVLSPIIYEEGDNGSGRKAARRTARMSNGVHGQGKRKLNQDGDQRSGPECGNAYRCDLSVENDVLSPIMYEEGENSSGHRVARRTARLSNGVHGQAKRKLNQDGDQRSDPKCSDFKKEMREADKDYKVFMDNLYVVGEHAYYVYGDQKRVYYNAGNQQLTDVEVEPLATDTRPRTSAVVRPSTPIKPPVSPSTVQVTKSKKRTLRDAQNMVNTSNKVHDTTLFDEEVSSYHRELQDLLRRPYDKDEYDELYACMSTRHYVNIYRDSRSGGSYRQGHLGKSYLDSYPDLNSEIEKVKSDRRKVLNLLRMFKIYLQKIPVLPSSEKKPWLVDFFKTILPGSPDNN